MIATSPTAIRRPLSSRVPPDGSLAAPGQTRYRRVRASVTDVQRIRLLRPQTAAHSTEMPVHAAHRDEMRRGNASIATGNSGQPATLGLDASIAAGNSGQPATVGLETLFHAVYHWRSRRGVNPPPPSARKKKMPGYAPAVHGIHKNKNSCKTSSQRSSRSGVLNSPRLAGRCHKI